GQGVQLAAHLALQGGVDQLVLPDAGQAREGRGDDARAVVVAVAGEVLDLDLGVGEGLAQMSLQILDRHRHGATSQFRAGVWRVNLKAGLTPRPLSSPASSL